MKRISWWSLAGYFILALTVLVSAAQAQRHGGRRMGGGPGMGGLCSSASTVSIGLTTIELVVKPTPEQQIALDELKSIAKVNTDAMTAVCAGAYPKSLPERLAASENRLNATLTAVRKLKPAAEKFYATLNDDQKSNVSILILLPGV